MNSERKQCQNCKNQFTVEPEDFDFYKKIDVPPPTWCPECRQFRRYTWRNERILYRRNCDLCQKSIVSIYSPNKKYKVYCVPCWWGDQWNSSDYGRDFDFSRPFFDQWYELHLAVPRIALLSKNSINSDYTNHTNNNKDCYLAFGTFNSENILYSNRVLPGKDCCDCMSLVGSGSCELCYECVNCERCYRCQYGYLLRDCRDCWFSFDCRNCSDCVLCWNIRNKRYCIKNVQYTKEEYLQKLEEMRLDRYEDREKVRESFRDIIRSTALHRPAVLEQVVASSGNFLSYTKNAIGCFFVEHAENAKFVINGSLGLVDVMDCYNFGAKAELAYECHAVTGGYNMLFSHLCYDNSYISYCDGCQNSVSLFGCVGVKKGEYQILNKTYEKEEYEKTKARIVEHMKETREYGEFFPSELSPFGYNETQGYIYHPLPKEEVLARGMKWEDQTTGVYGKTTIPPLDLAQNITETPDSVTKEILECVHCRKNYNIIFAELEIYRRMKIPIPRECPDCRYSNRVNMRPPRRLWHRQCSCNSSVHNHSQPCPNEFETAYAPDRPEIVYCESCYNAEVA